MSIPTALPLDPNAKRSGYADKLSMNAVAVAPAAAADAADGVDPAYRAKATEAAVKFESFFIGQMLHQMRSGTRELSAEDSVFKDKINQDMLDMADNLVADQMANQRAFGIADVILRQLLPTNTVPPRDVAMPGAARAPAPVAASTVAEPQNLSPTLNPAR
jgi:flagellar protein FlgJ